MTGWFTHEWIASLVLNKLRMRQFISKFENIDDYYFGAIAPDIRYVAHSPRETTHKPFGNDSLFEALKMSSTSMPFIAGYETHLITDMAWANEKSWLSESMYEHFKVNPNEPIQKFALYALVDDYFQAEAEWIFPIICAGNILRSNDGKILSKLGFSEEIVSTYKSVMAAYLREPGVDTINVLNFVTNNIDEIIVRKFLEHSAYLTPFLQDFRNAAVEKSIGQLERYL